MPQAFRIAFVNGRPGIRRCLSMNKKALIPMNLKPWIDARRRFRLSHAHVQMARELGMNPKKLGKLANHKQEPWKLPLPELSNATLNATVESCREINVLLTGVERVQQQSFSYKNT